MVKPLISLITRIKNESRDMEIVMGVIVICMILLAVTVGPMVFLFKNKVVWYKVELLAFVLPFVCYVCVVMLADYDIVGFLYGTNLSGFAVEQLILAGLVVVLTVVKILFAMKIEWKKRYSVILIVILCLLPIYFRAVDLVSFPFD